MDLDWILGAAIVLVTQAVTLFADSRRRRWAEEGERRRRVEERSEEAAVRLLALMDEGRAVFGDFNQELEANRPEVYELCHRIHRDAVMLRDPVVREAMKYVADALWHGSMLAEMDGARPYSIAFIATNSGRNALGFLLRGEPLDAPAKSLVEYRSQVDELYRVVEPDES